jgi:hypothetical protein
MIWALPLPLLILAIAAVEHPLATRLPAPSNCKKLPIDSDWPSEETWKTELQGSTKRGPQKKWTTPDYTYLGNTVAKIQTAVKFAAKHSVRLSILSSGHDFIGR